MQKCPNCGFEPVEGNATCPKCGFSLQLNDQENTKEINDTIEWSDLADMPIESVQKMFKDNEDKMKEENSKESAEETPEMNPILAQYIREHKDDQDTSEKSEAENESEEANEADSVIEDENERSERNEAVAEKQEPVSEENIDDNEEESIESVEETELEADEEVSFDPAFPYEEETETIETEESEEPEAIENSDDGTTPSEKHRSSEEKPKKSRKTIYITLAAIAVLGAGGGYYYHHEKEVEAQRIATVKKENQALDSIEESISSYYTDDQHTFLVAEKVNLNTSKIAEELSKYKDHKRYDDLKKDYDELTNKQQAEQSVNQLFTSAAINGNKIADKPLLKAAEPVDLAVDTGDKEFDDLMNQALTNAKDQYTKIDAAKKATDGLLKDGNVIDSITRDQYNKANDAVKAVANQPLVQSQKDELTKVDQVLKDKEKKAAEEKAAAEKAAQEAQNSANTSQAGDTSSDAYAWAPGVREKVIQTCISRGYIVEGGYSLEPVKVENGEGYYNLYATSNRASLTKGYSDSDLPMYLVTINCKTGWFKGNGPN